MIISKDLRIVNYLLKDGKIVEVAVINADNTIRVWNEEKTNTLGCFRLKDFDPIPLTEEWLLKFGFSKTIGSNESNFTDGVYNLFINSLGEVNFYFFQEWDWSQKIDYVHQLQNLYFALTGEELTIC